MRERKTRSDKKREVAPYVSAAAYELVSRISYICDLPMKTVGEMIGREALHSRETLEVISRCFRRDFKFNDNHVFLGRPENKPFRMQNLGEDKQRLHMKYYAFEHDRLSEIAFALNCSISMATGYLIQTALRRKEILYPILSRGIIRQLDKKRAQQLHELCRYMDTYSPDNYITMPLVISKALRIGLQESKKIEKTLNEWNQIVKEDKLARSNV